MPPVTKLKPKSIKPKEVTNPIVKRLIFDVITFKDGVDPKTGGQAMHPSFPREYYAGYCEMKDALNAQIEVGLIQNVPVKEDAEPQPIKEEDVTWMPAKEYKRNKETILYAERYPETPITLSPDAISTLRYFYTGRKEIPAYAVRIWMPEAMSGVEALISE